MQTGKKQSMRGTAPKKCSESTEESDICNFFRDRSVFLTGATGFVGKVLLEKLLRSCSQVRTVYVLMRPKEGNDGRYRIDELLASQVFDILRMKNPAILTKVVPVCGDITLPGLGISDSDTAMLCKHVSVVIHSAATVRFDEPLKKSVELNLLATQRVAELCQNMAKIAALIHVSTAYTYCNREEIDETVYPERVSPERVIELSRWMDDSLIESILPRLMDGRPTTYHYTKALAENYLLTHGGSLPIAIVRPSIVTAAYKEPMPGWVDGLNGPSTFIIQTGRGLLRTMMVYKDIAVDWIPVDLLANLILTACWQLGTQKPSALKVYNCTSGELNRITWCDIERTAYPLITKHPSMKVIRYPGGSFKSSRFLNTLSVKLQHRLPAYVIDLLAGLIGYKTEFSSMVTRMERAATYLDYFTTKQWKFNCRNFVELMDVQSEVDKKIFNFDIRPIEWTPYLETYVLGIRKYILNEDESTLPAARRRLARLYYAGLFAQWFLGLSAIHVLLTRTNLSTHIMWTLIGFALRLMKYMPKSWLKAISNMMQ